MRPVVALATMRALPALDPDDAPLVRALTDAGAVPRIVVWDDPGELGDAAILVVRSTWDYTERRDAFVAFIRDAAAQTVVVNPPAVIAWNTHKRYLVELAAQGLDVVPTAFVPRGAATTFAQATAPFHAREVVVKPAVSAGARRTHRLAVDDAAAAATFAALVRDEDVLVQPLIPSILDEGELSLLFFGGAYSHAVVKTPARGDFRVQEQHGGTFTATRAPDDAVVLAQRCLAMVPDDLCYARVDLVRMPDRGWALMELELVEPSLYFAHDAGAASRCAQAILARARR